MVTLSSRGESGLIPKNAVARKPRRLQPVFWELLSSNTDFGLETLQTLLGVSKSPPSTTIMQNLSLGCKDPVFVSIDTEPWMNESGEREFVRELGISILDTRILQDSTIQNPHSALSTFNYTTQRNIVTKRHGINEKSIFRHGPTQYIEKGWLKWLVRKVLRNGSPDPACTEIRNTILVGHTLSGDLNMLGIPRCGKFLLRNFPDLLILDTEYIAKRLLGEQCRLHIIMKRLGMMYNENDLHCGGNDANYTLRVLLMLAIYDDIKIGNDLQPRSKLLETIARPRSYDRLPRYLEYLFIEDSPGPLIQDFKIPAEENMEEEED